MSSWYPSKNISNTLSGYNIREERELDEFGTFDEMTRMHVWEEMYSNDGNSKLASLILINLLLILNFLME